MSAPDEKFGNLQTALAHTAHLMESDAGLAELQAREILKVVPGHPEALRLLGSALRLQGKTPEAVEILSGRGNLELIWASPREVLNVFQADSIGCHIITATSDILKKLTLVGKDLELYSLETVKMFHDDAVKAGFVIS